MIIASVFVSQTFYALLCYSKCTSPDNLLSSSDTWSIGFAEAVSWLVLQSDAGHHSDAGYTN